MSSSLSDSGALRFLPGAGWFASASAFIIILVSPDPSATQLLRSVARLSTLMPPSAMSSIFPSSATWLALAACRCTEQSANWRRT